MQIDAGVVSAIKLADGQNLYVDVTAIEQQLDTDFGLKILSPFDNSLIYLLPFDVDSIRFHSMIIPFDYMR